MIISKTSPNIFKIFIIYRLFKQQINGKKYLRVKAKFSIDARNLMTPTS